MDKTALVVDNDFFFVEFLTELLEVRGYDVVKAYDGKEGMEKLNEKEMGILFADIVMPKVDGWQLIRYVRKRFPARPFPVVAVSGTIIEQLDDLSQIDADYYIAKGPMEKMKAQFNGFMDKIEARPFPTQADDPVFDLGKIYPRRESIELIESLNFQRAITESLGLGVLVVDRDAKVISANSAALNLMAKSDVAVLNHKIHLLFDADERPKLVEAMKKVAREPESGKSTVELTVNGGSVRFTVTLLCFEDKEAGWVVAMEDARLWEGQA